MATIGTAVTLADLARRSNADGKIVSDIVELMSTTNEVLSDMLFVEGNLPTGHQTTVRTGLPSATWRQLNYGVQKSKSQTAQVTDTCGMLEAYAEVDKKLAELNGNSAAWRLSEDQAFLESMNQTMASTLFYGDTTVNPERFMGLHKRFNALSTTVNQSGYNIIDAGGTSSVNTSIWLVVWGSSTVHGIVPKGSTAGFKMRDLGEVTATDAAGGYYQVLRTHYAWDIGLTVRDWRYIARVANIDTTNMKAESNAADLSKNLIKALEKIPSLGMGRAALYANRDVATYLRIQALAKSNVNLSFDQAVNGGSKVLTFDGIPIRRCDAILNTEARITA
jgi:hypothetical protein